MTWTPSMPAERQLFEHALSSSPSLCRSCQDWDDLAVILVAVRPVQL